MRRLTLPLYARTGEDEYTTPRASPRSIVSRVRRPSSSVVRRAVPTTRSRPRAGSRRSRLDRLDRWVHRLVVIGRWAIGRASRHVTRAVPLWRERGDILFGHSAFVWGGDSVFGHSALCVGASLDVSRGCVATTRA